MQKGSSSPSSATNAASTLILLLLAPYHHPILAMIPSSTLHLTLTHIDRVNRHLLFIIHPHHHPAASQDGVHQRCRILMQRWCRGGADMVQRCRCRGGAEVPEVVY
jgi:hypothetical protein